MRPWAGPVFGNFFPFGTQTIPDMYNRGRIVPQQWLFVALEREGGRFILKTVEHRDSETLGRIIKDFIVDNATVMSDQWAPYISFFGNNGSYNHNSVNHSQNFVSPTDNNVHTQTIESFWNILKRWLRSRNLSRR